MGRGRLFRPCLGGGWGRGGEGRGREGRRRRRKEGREEGAGGVEEGETVNSSPRNSSTDQRTIFAEVLLRDLSEFSAQPDKKEPVA